MAGKEVITIGREFGSGGHEVGRRLAAELGLKLYDKELMKMMAQESNICEQVLEDYDEKNTGSLLYSIMMARRRPRRLPRPRRTKTRPDWRRRWRPSFCWSCPSSFGLSRHSSRSAALNQRIYPCIRAIPDREDRRVRTCLRAEGKRNHYKG